MKYKLFELPFLLILIIKLLLYDQIQSTLSFSIIVSLNDSTKNNPNENYNYNNNNNNEKFNLRALNASRVIVPKHSSESSSRFVKNLLVNIFSKKSSIHDGDYLNEDEQIDYRTRLRIIKRAVKTNEQPEVEEQPEDDQEEEEISQNLLMDNSSTFLIESKKFFDQDENSGSKISNDLSSSAANFLKFDSQFLTKILIGFLLYSITIWTIIGNILVCVIVVTNKQLKQGGMSNILIGNLALSDLLLGLTVLPFSATLGTFKKWIFGRILCDLWLSIDVLCSTASIWGLLVISLDRYIATNHPIRYRKQKNNLKVAILYCAVSWLISILISLGPLFLMSSSTSDDSDPVSNVVYLNSTLSFASQHPSDVIILSNNNNNHNHQHENANNTTTNQPSALVKTSTNNLNANKKSGLRQVENSTDYECVLFQKPSFVILSSLGSFYLPLVLMIILYGLVFLKIRQQSQMFKNKEKLNRLTQSEQANLLAADKNDHGAANKSSNQLVTQNGDDKCKTAQTANLEKDESHLTSDAHKVNLLSPTKAKKEKSTSLVVLKDGANANNTTSNNGSRNSSMRKSQKKRSFKRPLSNQLNTSEARITKTLGIIMGVFIACWLPFFIIYNIRSQLNDPDSISGNIMDIFLWLGYFNSALNPILYAILNRNFRNAFRDILSCECFATKRSRNNNRQLRLHSAPAASNRKLTTSSKNINLNNPNNT